MLERQLVGECEHLGLVLADDDPAVIRPGHRRDIGSRQGLKLPLHLRESVRTEPTGRGEQDRRRGGSVLGLAQQVSGADLAVDGVVREQERLCWSGEQIDPHPPVQLALGLGHERVAWPDQHVHPIDELGPQRQ